MRFAVLFAIVAFAFADVTDCTLTGEAAEAINVGKIRCFP